MWDLEKKKVTVHMFKESKDAYVTTKSFKMNNTLYASIKIVYKN